MRNRGETDMYRSLKYEILNMEAKRRIIENREKNFFLIIPTEGFFPNESINVTSFYMLLYSSFISTTWTDADGSSLKEFKICLVQI